MKTIKLTSYSPSVFDDPEYCEKNGEWCNFIYGARTCTLFNEVLYRENDKDLLKCQECKNHYQLSKQVDKTTNN